MDKNEILDKVLDFAEEALQPKEFIPGKTPIPVSYPDIRPEDVVAISNTVLDIWWTEHKQAEAFSRALCRYLGFEFAVLLNSGSSANLLASKACFGSKSEHLVITCATAFPTTVSPIYQCNKVPLYVDIDPYTLEPNYEQISYAMEHYGRDIAGCILAHNLGFPFDEELVSNIIGMDIGFVVDGCDAFSASLREDLSIGNWADALTLSFFPAHQICSIEGGAVITNNELIAEVVDKLRSWGRSCMCKPGQTDVCGKRFSWDDRGELPEGWDHKYIFDELGYNLKMTDLQAALGVSQMKRANEIVWTRQNNFASMQERMRQIDPDILRTVVIRDGFTPSPFGFPIIVGNAANFTARELIAELESYKIFTRPVFGGNITRQPAFMKETYVKAGSLEGSDFVMNNMFWIGCGSSITEEMIDFVFSVIENFLEKMV